MVFKVVSVEDELEIAELLRIVLANPELEVHTADNGKDGLALVKSLKPNLVMLDVMMPGGMNGWDIYDAIRVDPDIQKTPIIMLSVLREKPERRQAFAGSEIDLYVTKPFDTMRLRREVERLLGRGGLWKTPAERKAEASAPPPVPQQAEHQAAAPQAAEPKVVEQQAVEPQKLPTAEPKPVIAEPEAAAAHITSEMPPVPVQEGRPVAAVSAPEPEVKGDQAVAPAPVKTDAPVQTVEGSQAAADPVPSPREAEAPKE